MGNIWNERLIILNPFLLLYLVDMSCSMEGFVGNPQLVMLSLLKKSDLVPLVNHYKLEIATDARKADIKP